MTTEPKLNIPPPMEKVPPWFSFWVNDFLSSSKVELMKPEMVGGYLFLLLKEWQSSDCSLPVEDVILAKYSRLERRWSRCRDVILRCFVEQDGKLYNPKLLEVRWDAIKKIEKARNAANARWGKGDKKQSEKKCVSNANALHEHKKEDANAMHEQCLGDAQAMPFTITFTNIKDSLLKNISWIASAAKFFRCECGGEVVLHTDTSGKFPPTYFCQECGKAYQNVDKLEEIE